MDLHRPRVALGLTAVSAALLLAACGGSSDGTTTQSSAPTTTASPTTSTTATGGSSTGASTSQGSAAKTTLKLSADASGQLAFDTTSLKAKAGTVTLDMANPASSGVPHAIAVKGDGIDKDGSVVEPGGSSTVTVKLKPGTYTFYCPVPGHEAAGMKGTLTVR